MAKSEDERPVTSIKDYEIRRCSPALLLDAGAHRENLGRWYRGSEVGSQNAS